MLFLRRLRPFDGGRDPRVRSVSRDGDTGSDAAHRGGGRDHLGAARAAGTGCAATRRANGMYRAQVTGTSTFLVVDFVFPLDYIGMKTFVYGLRDLYLFASGSVSS